MNSFKKNLLSLLLNLAISFFLLSFLFIVVHAISQKLTNNNSVISKLASIDFYSFFITLALTSSFLIVATSSIELVLRWFNFKEKTIESFFIFSSKFSYASSLVITMLVTLIAEQFDILITTLSFIGIFTFIVPEEFIKKFRN